MNFSLDRRVYGISFLRTKQLKNPVVHMAENKAQLIVVFIMGLVIGVAVVMLVSESGLCQQGATTVVEKQNATITLLPNKAYYLWTLKLVERANKSIHIAVYVMKYDPKEPPSSDPVNMLLLKLVEAKNRGVDVKVVVDDVTLRSYPKTIQYLKANGIPVRLDPKGGITTHAKIVIVDGEWIIIGSHNWTESALSNNNEYSVLIRSKSLAAKVEEYFDGLWRLGRLP